MDARNARGFWNLLNLLLAVVVITGLLGCGLSLLCGSILLSTIFTPAYSSLGGLLSLLIVATTVAQIAGIIESSLIAARLTAVQLPMHACTLGGCLAMCLLFIPGHGLYGAVLALIFCRFAFIVNGVLLLRNHMATWSQAEAESSNDVPGNRIESPAVDIKPPHLDLPTNGVVQFGVTDFGAF